MQRMRKTKKNGEERKHNRKERKEYHENTERE
jgi:hypothetical protein